MKLQRLFLLSIMTLLLTGCSTKIVEEQTFEEVSKYSDIVSNKSAPMSKQFYNVYTTKKQLSLTFNGMGDKETMEKLLDELDQYHLKATFFLPGMRVAEEPDIAKEIISRGHEIGNNTLNQVDLNELPYEEAYKEIYLTNEIIKNETGISPKYLRTKSGNFNDNVRLAAANTGLDAVISYNINPQDWDMKDAKAIGDYIKRFVMRGGIISLNTDINPEVVNSIPYIYSAVSSIGYELVTLNELISGGEEWRPLKDISGSSLAVINPNIENVNYQVVEKLKGNKEKEIALTFDDWGSDFKVTQILNILKEQDVKATFFLRANGVEANPNLARSIVEEGHDVANHTYSHPVITQIDAEQLQDEIVKAHQVLTEAIQQPPLMLFRPPTGELDEETAKIVAATGYETIVLYDVTAMDWDVKNDAEDILSSVLEQTENGSIILLHLQDEISTAEALPNIILELKKRGYSFVKLSKYYN